MNILVSIINFLDNLIEYLESLIVILLYILNKGLVFVLSLNKVQLFYVIVFILLMVICLSIQILSINESDNSL